MRVFHSLVFDENIESTATSTIDASWNSQLGLPDKLTIFAVTDTVSGGTSTSVTLNVKIQESPDQVHWADKATAAELTATVATNANGLAVGRDPGTTPSAGFIRLLVWLQAQVPKGHVRLWVTGRGEQIP
jgi:hypothetical protein